MWDWGCSLGLLIQTAYCVDTTYGIKLLVESDYLIIYMWSKILRCFWLLCTYYIRNSLSQKAISKQKNLFFFLPKHQFLRSCIHVYITQSIYGLLLRRNWSNHWLKRKSRFFDFFLNDLVYLVCLMYTQAPRVIGTGTFGCGTVIVEGEDFISENITFENSAPEVFFPFR